MPARRSVADGATLFLVLGATMLAARNIVEATMALDQISLTYDERFLRRKVLRSAAGEEFLVDLASTMSLAAGQAFELEDGRRIAVLPADEPLLEITGPNLTRLAWHIGAGPRNQRPVHPRRRRLWPRTNPWPQTLRRRRSPWRNGFLRPIRSAPFISVMGWRRSFRQGMS